MQGLEKLRGVTGPAVIVSNHQSTIDAFAFGAVGAIVNFRVTFKRELLFVPGIGSALYLSGHVPVKRGDKTSAQR